YPEIVRACRGAGDRPPLYLIPDCQNPGPATVLVERAVTPVDPRIDHADHHALAFVGRVAVAHDVGVYFRNGVIQQRIIRLRPLDLLHMVDGGQFLQAVEGYASGGDFVVLDDILDQGALLEPGLGQVFRVAREVHDDVHGGTGEGAFEGCPQLSGFV